VGQQQTGNPVQEAVRAGLRLGRRISLLAFALAAPVSLLLHAGMLVAALDWGGRVDPGAIPDASDAISVELAATETVDSRKPDQASEPAPAPETPAPVAGSSTPAKPAEAVDPPPKREPVEEAEPARVPDADDAQTRAAGQGEPSDVPPAPAVAAAPASDIPPDAVPEPPKAAVVGEEAQARPKQTKKAEKRSAQPLGGIVSKSKAGKGTGSGRVSASTGSMLAYADLVRARVAPNRSSETGAVGTAVVAFGITSTGRLAYARIARSSGNAANDGIALAVVRSAAPFPPPPAGASPGQLQFTVPYHFR
jgi:protein TonB